MKRLPRLLLLALCVVTLVITPLYAQKTTGTLTGTVTDPSGAVVSNAQVTVSKAATGLTRTASTDASGLYTLPELEPGTYKLSTKALNFKETITQNVEVHVAEITKVNVTMAVGGSTETVEVNAETVQVQTDSAALGNVIDSVQVKELPLNGRSFVALTQLAPGVSGANNFDSKNKGLQGGVDFSVNGNSVTNNLFLVDGANDNDVGSNRTILIYPSIEAIAEFKMLANSYGPEYGQASGAVISLVTKGGTNQFHGSVFYSGRNDALNAWNYFAKQGGTKDVERRNDYGFSVGGPIKKDKLFFFVSEEWNKEKRGITHLSCLPTAAERSGDFSQDFVGGVDQCGAGQPHFAAGLVNPATPFKLNSLSPAGALIIQKYPLPNLATPVNGNNWASSQGTQLNWHQDNFRGDWTLNKNNSIMGRYTQDHWDNPAPNAGSYWGDDFFPALNSSWSQPSKMIVGKWTSTIGGSMVNDAEFAYSNNRINVTAGGSDPGLLAQISAAVAPVYPESLKHASVGLPTIWGGFGNYGSGQNYWMQAPWNNTLDIYSFRDDLSKVVGNHAFKFGAFLGWDGKNEDVGNPGAERPAFGAADWAANPATGNPLANVLAPGTIFNLGEASTNVRAQMRWRDYEFYAGDTWKARRNLTVEYGIRYSLLLSPFQAYGQSTGFNPALYDPSKPASDACNGLWTVPGTDPCGAANAQFGTTFSKAAYGPNKYLTDQNYHLFAPRLGIAWDPKGDGSWAIRTGLGQFFQRERVSGPYYILAANAPFAVSGSINRTLDGPTPASVPGAASPAGGRSPVDTLPNSWQWNLSVEHSFLKDTALQLAYVGNRAIHQTTNYDINAPSSNLWAQTAFLSGGALNADRPYSNFGQLAWWTHQGDANYHSLQVLFKTRYKRSQLQAAYTWSHSIADVLLDNSDGGLGVMSFTDPTRPGLDKGNSPINRPQMFIANFTFFLWDLKGQNAFTRAVFGGWELSGITQAAAGASHTVYQNGIGENYANDGVGVTCLVGGVPTTPCPQSGLNNLIGVSNNGMLRPDVTNIACDAGRKGSQLYNIDAFTVVGATIGTIGPNNERHGYCPGPKLINTDFSIDKNWKIGERVGLQFRLDFFDLFNHPNFRGDQVDNNVPVLSVNCGPAIGGKYSPCSPTNNVITAQTGRPQNQFGNSTSTVGNAGRELQYGLKVTF